MQLLVRNLARTTTEQEIRELFEAHGTATECTLVLDKATGTSKGFGLVEMPDAQQAKLARAKSHEPRPGSKQIRATSSQQK